MATNSTGCDNYSTQMGLELKQVAKSLQEAIRSGDDESAQALVQHLALLKAPVVINLEDDTTSPPGKIRLRVQFEDRCLSGPSIDLHVSPTTTIGTVKCMIYKKLKFPPEVQRCIVGRRVRHNKETLARCGLTYDGCVIYVYILSAQTVGLNMADEEQNASQNNHPLTHSISLVDNLEQMQTVGAGTSQDTTMPPVMSPKPFSPDAVISSPQAQLSSDAATFTDIAPTTSVAAPVADASNVECRESSHSMTSVGHSDDDDVSTGVAAAEKTPAEEVPWSCVMCTYLNHGCMTVCELCSSSRPGMPIDVTEDITDDVWHEVCEEPQQMNVNDTETDGPNTVNSPLWLGDTRESAGGYNDLLQLERSHVVSNVELFDCPICLDKCQPGHGVVLRECLHMFCSHCLEEHVRLAESAVVKCPFNNGDYACSSVMLDREIKALVSPDSYQKYLQRSLQEAECRTPNSYHCATPNCPGWCTFEDEVNSFFCYACSHGNCLTCRAIHEDMNCAEYQRKMKAKFQTDHAARMAQASLQELLKFGEALNCPTCGIVIMKKEGCDWIQCTMCKTEICWVTRQSRWGPKGNGDTSGGCRCRVNGKLCHPDCQNCH